MRRMLIMLAGVLWWVGSASAGCSWVLWAQVVDVNTQTASWVVHQAFKDQAACERDRRDTIASEKEDFGDTSKNPGTVLYKIEGKNTAMVSYKCFPDTI